MRHKIIGILSSQRNTDFTIDSNSKITTLAALFYMNYASRNERFFHFENEK